MRTTLTIDDQITKELKKLAYDSGRSFKEVVNETLRRGLASRKLNPETRAYRVRPRSLGGPMPGVNLDKALQLAEALEDEETRTRLELRK